MNNSNQLTAVIVMVSLIVLIGLGLLMTYGGPMISLKVEGYSLYDHIESGSVGMQCTNEKGENVTAQSHFFGPQWPVYIPDVRMYPHSYVFSITCSTYYGLAPTITASYQNQF